MYVSNANDGTVSVLSYPRGDLVGTLTGFKEPYGYAATQPAMSGSWMTKRRRSPNTRTAPRALRRRSVTPNEYPAGCSVDPKTGNLAVTNYEATNRGPGSVAIYTGATGTPTLYWDSSISRAWFCSYDAHGNLFVDGDATGSSGFQLAELPYGLGTFTEHNDR